VRPKTNLKAPLISARRMATQDAADKMPPAFGGGQNVAYTLDEQE
jgi:hypothetical protein